MAWSLVLVYLWPGPGHDGPGSRLPRPPRPLSRDQASPLPALRPLTQSEPWLSQLHSTMHCNDDQMPFNAVLGDLPRLTLYNLKWESELSEYLINNYWIYELRFCGMRPKKAFIKLQCKFILFQENETVVVSSMLRVSPPYHDMAVSHLPIIIIKKIL